MKRWSLIALGLVLGFAASLLMSVPLSMAQFGSAAKFSTVEMSTPVPASYGQLVAVSGVNYYFQAVDGTVYILRTRTDREWDSKVTVIKRG